MTRPDTSGCSVYVPPEGCPDRPYCPVHKAAPCESYYAEAPEGDRRCDQPAEHWVSSPVHFNRNGFTWTDDEAREAYERSKAPVRTSAMDRARLARGGRGEIDAPPGKFESAARGLPWPATPAPTSLEPAPEPPTQLGGDDGEGPSEALYLAAGLALIPYGDGDYDLFEWHPHAGCSAQPCACTGAPYPSDAVRAAIDAAVAHERARTATVLAQLREELRLAQANARSSEDLVGRSNAWAAISDGRP